MENRPTVRVTIDLSGEEVERRAREAWRRKHDTPFPGLKNWILSLIREQYDEMQSHG